MLHPVQRSQAHRTYIRTYLHSRIPECNATETVQLSCILGSIAGHVIWFDPNLEFKDLEDSLATLSYKPAKASTS